MTNHQVMAQRNRLLDQQQQQRVLVNNASRGDINVSYQNIDNILDATPPNVSLQVGLQVGLIRFIFALFWAAAATGGVS